jgi:hypothetical protein
MKRLARSLFLVVVLLVAPLLVIGVLVAEPGCVANMHSTANVDPELLRKHVVAFSETYYPRSFTHAENLDRCAAYIGEAFRDAGGTVTTQEYEVLRRTYRNVIGRFGPATGAVVVVGAHYDAFGSTPGADDNASGVAGLIELARLLGRGPPAGAVELVAYANEEPPFFTTPDMGSVRHARSLRERGAEVRLAIVLEMIGFFSDQPRSQRYPVAVLKLFYPGRGNFIGVVGRPKDRRDVRLVHELMARSSDLDVRSAAVPRSLPGVDFSDHRSYWEEGYPAVMVTDTAFYRNPHYHTEEDRADTLDYTRMAKVVIGVYEAVKGISSGTSE